MISLRYHIVAIVAVFLALAIGVLVGGAFVQPALEDRLRDQTDELNQSNAALREQIDEARAQAGATDAFVEAALPYLIEGRLLGRSVVVVTQEGVEDAVLGEAQRSLQGAGATVVAALSAQEEIASEDPETQARLAGLLGVVVDSPADQLPELTASALAQRLANEPTAVAAQDDLLAQLLSAGFLAPVGSGLSESTLAEIGSAGQVVVVLGGGDDESVLPPENFAGPLVDELAAQGVLVAAGESSTTVLPFVDDLRGTDGIVTVDDLDLSMGGAALVLGLDELVRTGQGGAYGIKDGAEPLPPPP